MLRFKSIKGFKQWLEARAAEGLEARAAEEQVAAIKIAFNLSNELPKFNAGDTIFERQTAIVARAAEERKAAAAARKIQVAFRAKQAEKKAAARAEEAENDRKMSV